MLESDIDTNQSQNQIQIQNNKIDITKNIEELNTNGYTVISDVYNNHEILDYRNEFFKWIENIPDIDITHKLIDFNGIFKHHEVGHQRFAWLARTNKKIINIFKQLWNTDDLVTSFDGCCYYDTNYIGKPSYWTHTDQSSRKKGLTCYQSFLSLTNNIERTFVVYQGSHLLHEQYFKDMDIDEPRDWNILDENYVNNLKDRKKILKVNAGDLVVWDSRTFHQNTCGNIDCNEERLVQYLCYLPKFSEGNNIEQQNLRRKYFNSKRTTSHWVYPMNVVPKQPNMYNYYNFDDPIYIDYDILPEPDIDDLLCEIEKLL